MKNIAAYPFSLFSFIAVSSVSVAMFAQPKQDFLTGKSLYATVEKYTSLGEHRTGTVADLKTSEWLGNELKRSGYNVSFYEFPLKQFFFEDATVTNGDKAVYNAFPLWYVSDSVKLDVTGELISGASNPTDVRGKIVILNFSFGAEGQGAAQVIKQLNTFIGSGAKGIIGYQENEAGEISAINAPKGGKAWKVPVVLVSPADGRSLLAQQSKTVNIVVKGTFRNIKARNVLGTIGSGKEYVVISTPISGWFICGGERGPGIAIWLALAKWVATQKLPYTFIFTGNSGHELGFWGGKEFLDHDAPPVDQTKLWIHLGAGIATLSWKPTSAGLVREDNVDPGRNFFYSASVKEPFDAAFGQLAGNKWDTKTRAGGELIEVIHKGYPNVLGAAYSHPYFHMRGDDASKTSPDILQETAIAFREFVAAVLATKNSAK